MKTKSYWLIIFFSWLIIFLLLAFNVWLLRPDIFTLHSYPEPPHVISEIDPNSEAFAVAAILPQVNLMCSKMIDLIVQNGWLKLSLNRCIKKLESERGLEPIPLKPLFEWERQLKDYDPNRSAEHYESNEPLYMPYRIPVDYLGPMRVRGDGTDIERLKDLMYLSLCDISNENRMGNFRERLKRLDANQPGQKP